MERHELDVVALVAGALFVAAAGAVLVGGFDAFAAGAGWLGPAALLSMGLVLGAVAVNRELRRRAQAAPAEPVAVDEPEGVAAHARQTEEGAPATGEAAGDAPAAVEARAVGTEVGWEAGQEGETSDGSR